MGYVRYAKGGGEGRHQSRGLLPLTSFTNILVNSHPAFFYSFKFALLSEYAVELKTSYRDGQRKAEGVPEQVH